MILLLAAHILLLRQLDKQSGTFNKLQELINPLLLLGLKKNWFDWMVYPWQVFCWLMPSNTGIIVNKKYKLVNSTGLKGRVVMKSWGLGIFPAIMNMAPGNFHWKIEEKWNQQKSLAVWFPAIKLAVFTRQLEILVTSLEGALSSLRTTIKVTLSNSLKCHLRMLEPLLRNKSMQEHNC